MCVTLETGSDFNFSKMSCFIKRQLLRSSLYDVSEDLPYNGVVNCFAWNMKGWLILAGLSVVLWSRYKIPCFNYLTRGLRRGEDVVRVHDHVEVAATDETQVDGVKKPWLSFKETLQKWFWLDREFLIQACAVSGYEYLSFQRYVAVFQLIICIFGLSVILPINLAVGTVFPAKTFSATTMSNLVPKEHHPYFWAHVVSSTLILAGTLLCMRFFFSRINMSRKDESGKIRRTLYLSKLPRDLREPEAIKDYFKSKYPGSNVKAVRVNFELKSISGLQEEHSMLTDIIEECSKPSNADQERLFKKGGACPSCCRSSNGDKVPPLALGHYQQQKEKLEEKLKTKVENILENKETVDSAFVQVESLEISRQIGNDR